MNKIRTGKYIEYALLFKQKFYFFIIHKYFNNLKNIYYMSKLEEALLEE